MALAAARGLAAEGVPVTLFTAVGPVAPELVGVPGLEVICLEQREIVDDPNRVRAMRNGIANRAVAARLGEVLDGCDPAHTVIHVHSWMNALSPLALNTAIQRGFKVVVTLHDFSSHCPTALFPAREGVICERVPLSVSCLACSATGATTSTNSGGWPDVLSKSYPARAEGVAHFVGVSEFSAAILRPHHSGRRARHGHRNPVECLDDGPAPVALNERFFHGPVLAKRACCSPRKLAAGWACPRFASATASWPAAREIYPQAILPAGADGEIRGWLRSARAALFRRSGMRRSVWSWSKPPRRASRRLFRTAVPPRISSRMGNGGCTFRMARSKRFARRSSG